MEISREEQAQIDERQIYQSNRPLGALAYQAFMSKIPPELAQAKPAPLWDMLSPDIQEAWIFAGTVACSYMLQMQERNQVH